MAETKRIEAVQITETRAKELAVKIKKGMDELVPAIVEFHDGQGWKSLGYKTWAQCCETEFGYSRRHVNRLIVSEKVVQRTKVGPSGPTRPTESQARELSRVPEEKQAEVWQQAVETAPKQNGKPKVTAKHVRKVAQKAGSESGSKKVAKPLIKPKVNDALSEGAAMFNAAMSDLLRLRRDVNDLIDGEFGRFMNGQQITADLANVRRQLKFAAPYGPCPYCGQKGCKACRKSGWVSHGTWTNAPKEMQDQTIKALKAEWAPK